MEIKAKFYGSWHSWTSRKAALAEILDWIMGTDGAERDRYTDAYCAIKDGETSVDTDK